jgi:hypothetical protein
MKMRAWLLAATVLASACTVFRSYSREQLRAELQPHFPVEKRRSLLVVRFSDPDVAYVGDRLALTLDIEATAALWTTRGRGVVEGAVEYRRETGGLYLRDPVVRELTFDKLPPEWGERLRAAVEQALALTFAEQPLYVLDEVRGGNEAKARQHLRRVFIHDDRLILELHS